MDRKKINKLILFLFIIINANFGQSKFFYYYNDEQKLTELATPQLTGEMVAYDKRESKMELSWTVVPGATMYYLYRDIVNNPTVLVDSTQITSISNVVGSGYYYYRIRARNETYKYSNYSNVVADTSYETEYWNYRSRVSTNIPDSTAWRINKFIKNLKDSLGINQLSNIVRVIYILANVDTIAAYTNLVGNYNKAIGINNPTFIPYKGITTSSTTPKKYLNTNFSPGNANDSIGFKKYSASQGIYIRTSALNNEADCGNNMSWIKAGQLTGTTDGRLNTNASGTLAIIISTAGFTITSRTTTNNFKIYQNNTLENVTWYAAQDVQNRYFIIGGYNTADVPNITTNNVSNREYAFYWVGLGLSDEEVRKVTNVVESFLDEIGAGVID